MEQKIATKKVVVIGPESTGKSTLCKQLADHYNCEWLPEYAREYLETNGASYQYEDLEIIARGQIGSEDALMSGLQQKSPPPPFLFIDTDLYVMKVWSEFVFNKCENRLLTQIAMRTYDLYLLCDIDLPWESDALREYPDLYSRQKLFHMYKDALVHQHVPWQLVSGGFEQRLSTAVSAIDRLK